MKLGLKLTMGFLILALLIGAVGWLGLRGNRQAASLYAELGGHFAPFTNAATGITGYSKRAEGHLFLYLLYGDQVDRDKFFSRHESLNTEIDTIEPFVIDNPQLIGELRSRSTEMLSIGEALLSEYDMAPTSFNPKEHEELIRRFHAAASSARKVGVELATVERELFLNQESVNLNTEVTSYSKRAEGHLILYLMLGDQADRDKFFSRHESLNDVITQLSEITTNSEEAALVGDLQAFSADILKGGETLLAVYDRDQLSFDLKDHEELIRKFFTATSGARKTGMELARVNTEEISIQVRSVDQSVKSTRRIILAVIVLAVVMAIAIGVVVSRSISRRVIKLRDAAAAFGEGNLRTRTDIESSDEIGELALSFNKMAENLEKEVMERTRAEEELRSHRSHLEERVTERTKELARSNAELEQFAFIATHDLQEPLRKIQSFGDLLARSSSEVLSEDARGYLGRMQDSAGRMRTLIDDLLSFSRVTSQVQPHAPVDLGRLTREVLSDLEPRIAETGGRVEVADLPTIDADPTQMRQLQQNLISNALKFHKPEEPPLVKIRGRLLDGHEGSASGGPQSDGTWEITVEDNGIDFDEKYLDRIFTLFQRLHGRGSYDGTGIGLATCRKIVERHGGSITATSTPGEGATFIVTLPASQPEGGKENE